MRQYILAILIILSFTAVGYEYFACDGTLYRTLFWLECEK